ncbi:hypothetical protein Gogos_015634 [Gossypium gossypioides]|uniref:AAA+ ATPase domain-containing protein n=1 Tax=Gossypium gossypioides TaxID=34282 RepID=A0A7J9C2A5_GOSGO|nr:hypothetical protein [Gossypium gossypioides]
MDPLGSVIVETGRCIFSFFFTSIATVIKLQHNTGRLRKEFEKLEDRKNGIEEDVRLAETEGKCATEQVKGWIRKVEEIEQEVQPMLEKADRLAVQGCGPCCNILPRYRLCRRMAKKQLEVQQLISSCCFDNVVTDKKSPVRAVEKQQGPSLAGQREAEEMIEKLMELLKGDENKRIAVWGMGGVGKTTLVRNLNNELESSSLMESIDIVIWITVSKDLDLKKVQSQIAKRLNLELDPNEVIEERAKMLLKRLMMKKFLLILDDVWEHIDLDIVGVPQTDDQANRKILLTTRSLDVCRAMMTDEEIKLDVLKQEAAWNLFAQNAGDVVEVPSINPLARAVAKECGGLPLALKTVGKSMRNKRRIELWKHALHHLQHSDPHVKHIEDEVYRRLKLSYDSLPSKILQSCFLFCSLYPENYSIRTDELIQCWIADRLINEHQPLEDCFNDGIALIETLKDSCLLEQGDCAGTVKLHDVVRDVAIWISTKQGSEKPCASILFTNITKPPKQFSGFSELTVILLVGNPINKIHDNLFAGLRKLRVLNLSQSHIVTLPPSLSQLQELRALLLRDCCYLEKLPSLGALHKLLVMDLSGTRLRELPNGTSKLKKLQELHLSRTHHLETIEAGTISGLQSLELLDMSFSAYKWDTRCNVDYGSASFNEILTLDRLSIVKLRLDKVDSVTLDSAWLMKLREFNIQISPGSCDSNHLATQHDEKRAILRGVDLMGIKGLNGLLDTASALDLVICGGISALSELSISHRLSSLQSVKSLSISKCDCITSLISGDNISGTILPNLEHLSLNRLENLGEILGGMVPRKGCLKWLKTIEVVDCKKLRALISFALLQQVKNLEQIKVKNCSKMKYIIGGEVSAEMIPKLRVIELSDLPMLKTICSRLPAWPALEMIEVRSCPMLTKLPFATSNGVAATLKEIRGELQWWNRLIYSNDEIKSSLQQRFQPLKPLR